MSRLPHSNPSIGLGQHVGATLGEWGGVGMGGSLVPRLAAQPPAPGLGALQGSRVPNG